MSAESPSSGEPSKNAARFEADYDRLFRLSRDLLCIAGLDGYFRKINPSWTRVLGWSQEELLSRRVIEFVHPEDRERVMEARAGLARGVPVNGLENRYLCKDGSWRWLSWQSNIEPGETLVYGVARDITERRQLDLERLVMSRLESTGILAGGIAHDFNNLLTAILCNLQLVPLGGEINDEQREYLGEAESSVLAAKALTEQLTTFAAGGGPVRKTVGLGGLLRQCLALALADSGVTGECDVSPELWPAEVDELHMRQVIAGLAINAREATPPGGVIRLSAANERLGGGDFAGGLAAGEYVRIMVSDRGCGIPAEVLPKIFDPYFSTKERGPRKGVGLGLSICRILVQQHGGTLTVESAPGYGTTVTCRLPASRRCIAAA